MKSSTPKPLSQKTTPIQKQTGEGIPAISMQMSAGQQGQAADASSPLSAVQIVQLQRSIGNGATMQLMRSRMSPGTPVQQRKLDENKNNTGLPHSLKSGVESLSGMSMDDVNVHYNSSKPANVQALAYAQGTDIHLGPGQERHLPHEAWHVVQQRQGRVKPTVQLNNVAINDDTGLEHEADRMGNKAAAMQLRSEPEARNAHSAAAAGGLGSTIQRMVVEDLVTEGDMKKTKDDKKKRDALKVRFNKRLGFTGDLYNFHEGDFDYEFAQASNLTDLGKRIDTAISKAEARKLNASAMEAEPPAPKPAPKIEESRDEASAVPDASSSSSSSSPSEPTAPKAPKKPKKVNLASTYFNSGPTMKQETVEVIKPTTNPIIQGWIAAKPAGAVITKTSMVVRQETVYIYATVKIPDNSVPGMPQMNVYQIEVHYHPVPISPQSNYLHVKRSAGADAGNIVTPASWLIPGGADTLRDAVSGWNADNSNNESPHNW